MRITYRTLAGLIEKMSDDQKDSDVTVEIPTESFSECYSAELRICGELHDCGLDDGHPVIFPHFSEHEQPRMLHINSIAYIIGLTNENS